MRTILLLMISIFVCMLLSGCRLIEEQKSLPTIESGSMKSEELQEYSNSKFKFTVSFPKNWGYEEEKTWDATATQEASPDGGVKIYVNKDENNVIYVYGCNGTINIPEQGFQKEFVKRDGKSDLILLFREDNSRIEAHCTYDEFHAVSIRLDREVFDNNKSKIYALLESIQVND